MKMTVTASKVVLLVGVLLILLSAFGVGPLGPFGLFEMGVGVAFASFLV